MKGKNFVEMAGYLVNPKFSTTANGYPKFNARLAVPVEYTRGGEQKIAKPQFNICAWNDVAEGLGELLENTPLIIHGHINSRSYDGACKTCNTTEKKYWVEVQVDSFVVATEE